MSVTTTTQQPTDAVTTERRLCGAIAALVVIDAITVGAPFLAIFALPFAIAAWRYRGRHRWVSAVLLAWCALWIMVGVAFMVNNGLHAPKEPGEPTETIGVGDFLSVYVGTPLTVWLAVRLATKRLRRR